MALPAFEFIRRFLQHVLPSGFVRIRHYGLLANRHREEKLTLCRRLLQVETPGPDDKGEAAAARGSSLAKGEAWARCPACGQGKMIRVEEINPQPRSRNTRGEALPVPACDSS